MKSGDLDSYFVANGTDELLFALTNKESYILISSNFKEKFLEDTQLPLSELEQMGFELGFRGAAGIFGSPFFHLINSFSKESKIQKKIDSKIRKYVLKKQHSGDLLLCLRQLDY